MDGANMNAQCGVTTPGDCGADVSWIRLQILLQIRDQYQASNSSWSSEFYIKISKIKGSLFKRDYVTL